MRNGDDADFFIRDLVDNAIREAAKQVTASDASVNGPDFWVRKNGIQRPLKLGQKGQAQVGMGAGGIKGRRVMQLGEGSGNNE